MKIKIPNVVWGALLSAIAMIIQYNWPDMIYAQLAILAIVTVAKIYNISVDVPITNISNKRSSRSLNSDIPETTPEKSTWRKLLFD